jgi:hypothetical protein
MDKQIEKINRLFFKKNSLIIENIQKEPEGQNYTATKFKLKNIKTKQTKNIIFRTGKSTPNKQGFFVTCWKRNTNKITIPFDTSDNFDKFIIYVKNSEIEGIFTFPKQILVENKIITDNKNKISKGKNGFRLYTPELTNLNFQATKTQSWQKKYYTILK